MEYIKEDVETMLRQHKDNEAKLTEVELKIAEYKKREDYAGTVYEDSEKDVIEGMQLSGQVLSDMPRGTTNKISDITYNTATNYKKEINHINREDRDFLKRKIEELENKKDDLDKMVVRVNNMMYPLSNEEKFVIETYYMDNSKWDYVEKLYLKEYEKYKSAKRLQTYRDNAINRMLKIINTGGKTSLKFR